MPGVPTEPRLRMFIDEIAPAVKERVADVRASRSEPPAPGGRTLDNTSGTDRAAIPG